MCYSGAVVVSDHSTLHMPGASLSELVDLRTLHCTPYTCNSSVYQHDMSSSAPAGGSTFAAAAKTAPVFESRPTTSGSEAAPGVDWVTHRCPDPDIRALAAEWMVDLFLARVPPMYRVPIWCA